MKEVFLIREVEHFDGARTRGVYKDKLNGLMALKRLQIEVLSEEIRHCKACKRMDIEKIREIDDGEETPWSDPDDMRTHLVGEIVEWNQKIEVYEKLIRDKRGFWWLPTGFMQHVEMIRMPTQKLLSSTECYDASDEEHAKGRDEYLDDDGELIL